MNYNYKIEGKVMFTEFMNKLSRDQDGKNFNTVSFISCQTQYSATLNKFAKNWLCLLLHYLKKYATLLYSTSVNYELIISNKHLRILFYISILEVLSFKLFHLSLLKS